jgi:hypothetical protein
LSYRRFQEAVLRQAGLWFEYAPAEVRGGAAAWRQLVKEHLTEPEYIPRWIFDRFGNYVDVGIRGWRNGDYAWRLPNVEVA